LSPKLGKKRLKSDQLHHRELKLNMLPKYSSLLLPAPFERVCRETVSWEHSYDTNLFWLSWKQVRYLQNKGKVELLLETKGCLKQCLHAFHSHGEQLSSGASPGLYVAMPSVLR